MPLVRSRSVLLRTVFLRMLRRMLLRENGIGKQGTAEKEREEIQEALHVISLADGQSRLSDTFQVKLIDL